MTEVLVPGEKLSRALALLDSPVPEGHGPGGRRGLPLTQRSGPMHTRVDLGVEKTLGDPSKVSLVLAGEVFNLFNQKDVRSIAPGANTAGA